MREIYYATYNLEQKDVTQIEYGNYEKRTVANTDIRPLKK
jgi:hypothetical protein